MVLQLSTVLTQEQQLTLAKSAWIFNDNGKGLIRYTPTVEDEIDSLREFDHVIITELNPLVIETNVMVTPYHELCMSHEILRETFQCLGDEQPVAQPGENWVKYIANEGWKMGYPVGVWGGSCTCPDGRVYTAGDRGNLCRSLACFGGEEGECIEHEGVFSFREVHCAAEIETKVAPVQQDRNVVIQAAIGVGTWGGTCTCPDGSLYLVGDHDDGCNSMACVNGIPGPCNHYPSTWRGRQVLTS